MSHIWVAEFKPPMPTPSMTLYTVEVQNCVYIRPWGKILYLAVKRALMLSDLAA